MLKRIFVYLRGVSFQMRDFGLFLPLYDAFLLIFGRFFPSRLCKLMGIARYEVVRRRLASLRLEKQECHSEDISQYKENAPIWFCWLQGEENMPTIPKLCLLSLRKHANGHPVIVLTENNLSDYVTISPRIVELYKKGRIRPAHFADILRINLIDQQGGLWLDSTLYVAKDIPEWIFELPFYSIKMPDFGFLVSKCRWTVFCLGGWQHAPLYCELSQMLTDYCRKKSTFITYFMLDVLIDMLYESNETIKEQIDYVPMNCKHVHELEKRLDKPFDSVSFAHFLKDTFLFKLSWKNFDEAIERDKDNYYNYLCLRCL